MCKTIVLTRDASFMRSHRSALEPYPPWMAYTLVAWRHPSGMRHATAGMRHANRPSAGCRWSAQMNVLVRAAFGDAAAIDELLRLTYVTRHMTTAFGLGALWL